jgi:hypothetical protein
MKKLIFLLMLMGIAQNATAGLEIQQITVSPLNTTDLNVHIIVADGYYFENYTHNYEIVNSTITLNICYESYLMQVGTFKEDDFVISNVNSNTTDFTLVVNVSYRRWEGNAFNCNSLVGSSSGTLVFSAPLNVAVSLKDENFEKIQHSFIIHPNPTTGIISFSGDFTGILMEVKIFDSMGRLVKTVSEFRDNSISLEQLEDGIYLVECISTEEKIQKKIILKK